MTIPIKSILRDYQDRTGIHISQAELARQMVTERVYSNFGSARNAIQNVINGRVKCLDVQMIEFLKKKFNLEYNQIIY
jgi:hypothetical protein